MVRNHRVGPPGYRLVGVPIGENCVAGPNGSNILATIRVVQENATIVTVSVDAVIIAGIIRIRDVDSRIDNAELMSALRLLCVGLLITYGM